MTNDWSDLLNIKPSLLAGTEIGHSMFLTLYRPAIVSHGVGAEGLYNITFSH